MTTQAEIISRVVETALIARNPKELRTDLPWIREALNYGMDSAERDGTLSRNVSNRWSQARMIKAVRLGIKKGLLLP